MRCTAGSKVKGGGVTSHRQDAQKVQQRPVARIVGAKPSKLPPARTYAALAERRHALQAQPKEVCDVAFAYQYNAS